MKTSDPHDYAVPSRARVQVMGVEVMPVSWRSSSPIALAAETRLQTAAEDGRSRPLSSVRAGAGRWLAACTTPSQRL